MRTHKNLTLGIGILALAASGPAFATAISGNGIYDAAVQEISDAFSVGSWSAATAAAHPTGGGNDLLYIESSGSFGTTTNYSSLRVYNSLGGGVADYTFGGSGSGSTDLDPLATSDGASPLGTGQRTVWSVTPEALTITQDVIVTGTTFSNSAIYHTVEVANTGDTALDIGWRNLYDWQVDDPGTDDGPNNSIETTGSTVVGPTTFEFSHTPAAGEFARVSIDPGVATYEPLLALGFDPGFIGSLPVTIPDEYAYVSWPGAFGTSFDYTVTPALDVTSDSAGLSWFGRDAARAYSVAPGSSVRFTQVVFGVAGGGAPPGSSVPEPGTLALLGLALGTLAAGRRRRAAA